LSSGQGTWRNLSTPPSSGKVSRIAFE